MARREEEYWLHSYYLLGIPGPNTAAVSPGERTMSSSSVVTPKSHRGGTMPDDSPESVRDTDLLIG